MVELGYENESCILNLHSVLILLGLIVGKLVVLIVFYVIIQAANLVQKCIGTYHNYGSYTINRYKDMVTNLINEIIWTDFIAFITETYIELLIGGILNIQYPLNESFFDKLSLNSSILLLVVIFILFPVSYIIVVRQVL